MKKIFTLLVFSLLISISVKAASYELTIGSTGYSTLALSFSYEAPAGVELYKAVIDEDQIKLVPLTGYVYFNPFDITTYHGVVVKAAPGTYTFTEYAGAGTKADFSDSVLSATTIDTYVSSTMKDFVYILSKDAGALEGVAFKPASLGTTIKANRAYIQMYKQNMAAPYTTMYLPIAVKTPADATVYFVVKDTENDNSVNLVASGLGYVPAETPVVIYSSTNTTHTLFAFYNGAMAVDPNEASNMLVGNHESVVLTDPAPNVFVLSRDGENNPQFMHPRNGLTVAAHKAHLVFDGYVGSSSSIGVRVPGMTNVDQVSVTEEVPDAIFDMLGRRVRDITTPGFYIVNGKKTYVK